MPSARLLVAVLEYQVSSKISESLKGVFKTCCFIWFKNIHLEEWWLSSVTQDAKCIATSSGVSFFNTFIHIRQKGIYSFSITSSTLKHEKSYILLQWIFWKTTASLVKWLAAMIPTTASFCNFTLNYYNQFNFW